MTLGNPSDSLSDDESHDFNAKDPVSGGYVALQLVVAPSEDADPVFTLNVDDLGRASIQFKRLWVGRGAQDGADPPTTIDIDIDQGTVVIAGEAISIGRGASEALVLGDTLASYLQDLIDAIINMRQPVAGAGPTAGPPVNVAQFQALRGKVQTLLSQNHKVL
jgi:hypothetical protein